MKDFSKEEMILYIKDHNKKKECSSCPSLRLCFLKHWISDNYKGVKEIVDRNQVKLTATGKWLLDAFMNKKEVDGQDHAFATIISVLQYYEDHMEDEWDRDVEGEEISILLGLLEG